MAVTVTDLRTTASDANSTTGWTGSATPTLFSAEPSPVFGTNCLGVVVSTATVDVYYTMGTAVNMSAGMLVYVWVFLRGEMDTTVNGGAQILLGDGTNRIGFHLAGSDRAGFRHDDGPVGWQCLVLDTANLPTASTVRAGSLAALNLSSITQIGAVFKTLVKSVGGVSNCFIDVIRYGNQGIRIEGGTSVDPATMAQVATVDRANTAALGVVRQLGAGSFGMQGSLTFGGTAATYFRGENTSIAFEDRSTGYERYFVTVEGTNNTFYLGSKVGTGDTATGSNGVNITVPQGVGANFTASNNDFRVYGSTLSGFTGGLTLPDNTASEFIGGTIASSGQVNSRQTQLRATTITGSDDTTGAYLWSATTNLSYSSITNNVRGILHTATGTYSYVEMGFSNNTFDVRNDSGGLVTINVTGGDSPTYENIGTSTTTVQNVVTFSLTGLVDNTEVRIYRVSDDVELFGVENSLGGTVSYEYNAVGTVPVYIHIHHINYVFIRLELSLVGSNQSVPVQQRFDRTYSNPG